MMKQYKRFFEKVMNYYKFSLIADDLGEYKNMIKELYKFENMFSYIKKEFDKPYKVGGQFRNTIYLSTNTLSLTYVYKIVNSIKPTSIIKLRDDPFGDKYLNPDEAYSGKIKISSL